MGLSFRHFNYFGYGIYNDIKSRLPHYKSDFTDAFNYRVIPSTAFIFSQIYYQQLHLLKICLIKLIMLMVLMKF